MKIGMMFVQDVIDQAGCGGRVPVLTRTAARNPIGIFQFCEETIECNALCLACLGKGPRAAAAEIDSLLLKYTGRGGNRPGQLADRGSTADCNHVVPL